MAADVTSAQLIPPPEWREEGEVTLFPSSTAEDGSRQRFLPRITWLALRGHTLDQALEGWEAPTERSGAERLAILRQGRFQADWGAYFERVIRFLEPQEGRLLQQVQRVFVKDGRATGVALTSEAPDFEGMYPVFHEAVRSQGEDDED